MSETMTEETPVTEWANQEPHNEKPESASPHDEPTEKPERALSYKKAKDELEKLMKAKADLEDKIAAHKAASKKAETRCKIELGGWLIACAKAAHNQGIDFSKHLTALEMLKPMPDSTAEYLNDRLKEILAQKPRKPKNPQKSPQLPS